jgi:ketosteroid isomerase-like protein
MTGPWAVEKVNPPLGRRAIEPHLLLISEEIVSHSTECVTSQEGLMTVADVDSVAKAFHDGVANQDAGALASLYHDDARFLPPNMEPAEGPEAIRATMQQLLDMGGRSLDVEPLDVREAGNLTIEYGRYILGIEPEGGAAMTDVGKYVVVHETRGDETKILLDCFNSNSPPPA